MRCHNCGAPRPADATVCSYCATAFTSPTPPTSIPGGPQSWDLEFVRMRRQPSTEALLHERAGLPPAPRPTVGHALLPFVLCGVLAAVIALSQRAPDGSYDSGALAIAAVFAAIGVAASVRTMQRSRKIARMPVEGRLVRVGLRDVARDQPNHEAGPRPRAGHGKARWVLALEEGTERYVWPAPGARGGDRLQRGAMGVAWLQGPHLLGFHPL